MSSRTLLYASMVIACTPSLPARCMILEWLEAGAPVDAGAGSGVGAGAGAAGSGCFVLSLISFLPQARNVVRSELFACAFDANEDILPTDVWPKLSNFDL